MADFSTHVFSAAALGSLGATLCTKLLALPPVDGVALTLAGIAGGVLPDVDLKVSLPSRILFALLGSIVALAWLFAHVDTLTVLELWFAAIGVFLLVRFPIRWLFHAITVHRGALHSIAAACMATTVTAAGASHVLDIDPAMSWMLAAFIACGYVLHLILDELYSVDISGMSMKRSFGSALKLVDRHRPTGSIGVIVVAVIAFALAPDIDPVIQLWRGAAPSWQDSIIPTWLFATRY